MSLAKKTIFEEEPRWVATRLQNCLVWDAINWAPGPQVWKDAARDAFNQLKPISSASLRHHDNFQNASVPDQRNPRFIAYLDYQRNAHSEQAGLQQNHESALPAAPAGDEPGPDSPATSSPKSAHRKSYGKRAPATGG